MNKFAYVKSVIFAWILLGNLTAFSEIEVTSNKAFKGSPFTSLYYKGKHSRLKYNIRVKIPDSDKEYSLLEIDGVRSEVIIEACLSKILKINPDQATRSQITECAEDYLGRDFSLTLQKLSSILDQKVWSSKEDLAKVHLYLYHHRLPWPLFFKDELGLTQSNQEEVIDFLDNRE